MCLAAWLSLRTPLEETTSALEETKPEALEVLPEVLPLPEAINTQSDNTPKFAEATKRTFHTQYGSEEHSPIRDLVCLNNLIFEFTTNFKEPDSLPTTGNADIVRALQGDNSDNLVFIESDFEFINEKGEIVDRWGTPLYFHFINANAPSIRSAGIDKQHWTEDDIEY